MKTRSSLPCLVALAWLLAAPPDCFAATLSVTNLADSGPGTLRQAIADAQSGDTITFATAGTITLNGSSLHIANNLTITGQGPGNLSVSGNNASRVFDVAPSATASISGIIIRDGRSAYGGGMLNAGTLVLSNCVITANGSTIGPSGSGGGIFNAGALALIACTVRDNSAGNGSDGGPGAGGTLGARDGGNGSPGGSGGNGGGVYNGGVLALTACTVNNNRAGNGGDGGRGGNGSIGIFNGGNGGAGGFGGQGGAGGGVYNGPGATLALTNCTVYGNSGGTGGDGGGGGAAGAHPLNPGLPGAGGFGGSGGFGGGIFNAGSASGLALTACTVSANGSGGGGRGWTKSWNHTR